MLTLDQLRVLQAIHRHGSIAAAARSLALTQPTLSHHLANLEALTGGQLVLRTARGSRLTELGELALGHAEPILDQVRAAETEIRDHVAHGTTVLKVGTFPSAGTAFVADALGRLASAGVAYELVVAEIPELERALRARHLHLAVIYSEPDVPPLLGDDTESMVVLDDPFVALIPHDHPAARRTVLGLRELADEAWISAAHDDDPHHQLLVRAYREIGVDVRLAARLDDYPTAEALVAAGLGLTLIPKLVIDQLAGRTAVRPLADPRFARRIQVAWYTRPHRSSAELLVEFIQEAALRVA